MAHKTTAARMRCVARWRFSQESTYEPMIHGLARRSK
jgi:hypothetical protein